MVYRVYQRLGLLSRLAVDRSWRFAICPLHCRRLQPANDRRLCGDPAFKWAPVIDQMPTMDSAAPWRNFGGPVSSLKPIGLRWQSAAWSWGKSGAPAASVKRKLLDANLTVSRTPTPFSGNVKSVYEAPHMEPAQTSRNASGKRFGPPLAMMSKRNPNGALSRPFLTLRYGEGVCRKQAT